MTLSLRLLSLTHQQYIDCDHNSLDLFFRFFKYFSNYTHFAFWNLNYFWNDLRINQLLEIHTKFPKILRSGWSRLRDIRTYRGAQMVLHWRWPGRPQQPLQLHQRVGHTLLPLHGV